MPRTDCTHDYFALHLDQCYHPWATFKNSQQTAWWMWCFFQLSCSPKTVIGSSPVLVCIVLFRTPTKQTKQSFQNDPPSSQRPSEAGTWSGGFSTAPGSTSEEDNSPANDAGKASPSKLAARKLEESLNMVRVRAKVRNFQGQGGTLTSKIQPGQWVVYKRDRHVHVQMQHMVVVPEMGMW